LRRRSAVRADNAKMSGPTCSRRMYLVRIFTLVVASLVYSYIPCS
jgi:hypothetical protein